MKKLFVASAFLLSFCWSQAQIQLGVHTDGIFAYQTAKASGTNATTDSRFSWKAGLVGNLGLNRQISFMPQLNLVNKGAKFEYTGTGNTVTQVTKLTYIELPLNLVYNFNGFFGGIGPVLSYGVSGKQTVLDGADTRSYKMKFDGKTDISDGYSHMKAFEFGGDLIAGYKLKNGVFFNAQYNLGLSNVGSSPEGTLKNNYFGFGVGYFFSK
jgi:hypothetical protein